MPCFEDWPSKIEASWVLGHYILLHPACFLVFSVSVFVFLKLLKPYGNFSKIILEDSGRICWPIPCEWRWFLGGFFQNGKTPTKITASQIRSFASFPRQFFGNNKIPPPPKKKKTLKQPNLEHGKDLPHSQVWSFQKTHTSSLCSRRETELKRKSILKASMKLAGWGKKGWTVNQPTLHMGNGWAGWNLCATETLLYIKHLFELLSMDFLRNCRWVNRKSSTISRLTYHVSSWNTVHSERIFGLRSALRPFCATSVTVFAHGDPYD